MPGRSEFFRLCCVWITGLVIAFHGWAGPPKTSSARRPLFIPSTPSNPFEDDGGTYLQAPSSSANATSSDLDIEAPGSLPLGSQEAASRQNFILQEAAKAFRGENQLPTDSRTKQVLQPEIDPETGLVKEDAEALKNMVHNKEVISSDAYGPLGPGRRERLAEAVGITPEEAKRLWPWPDPKPFTVGDMYAASKVLAKGAPSQETAEKNLLPGQNQNREEIVKYSILTDAEASFAVYAALGFPFPIRVGKVDTAGTTAQGFVVFSPELLRADITRQDWEDRTVTYRYMFNNEEVYKDTVHVRPFLIIPKPNAPVTHLWLSSDKDVMVYAVRGNDEPGSITQARDQIMQHVVQVNSWLRPNVKLYGIRWSMLPTADELTKNTATRKKLIEVLNDTGLMRQGAPTNEYAEEAKRMAEYVKNIKQEVPTP